MTVSVVIPTFNCSGFVGEAVRSALEQSEPPAEVIVVAGETAVGVLPERLTGYRLLVGSLSKNAVRMADGMQRILHKSAANGAYNSRPVLHRRAWSYYRYSCRYMHHQAGHSWTAVKHLGLSPLGYPFAHEPADVRYRFGRVKRLWAAFKGVGR